MQHRIRTTLIMLMALAVLLSFATFSYGSPPQAQNSEVIRIGSLILQNTPGDLGARLAVKELNERENFSGVNGTRYTLELVYPGSIPTSPEAIPGAIDFLNQQGISAILGPSENFLAQGNLEPLARAGVPVLTLATADTLTDFDVTNNIMRMQASERYYSTAAADYMVNDLQLKNIALIQTNIESTEAVVAFETALAGLGFTPVRKIQLVDATTLLDQIPDLLSASPDSIVFWGAPQDVNVLRTQLISAGWRGQFFYRDAQEALLNGELNPELAPNVYGMNGWGYSTPSQLSRQFLVNYAALFGRIPDENAAAAYDAIYVLAGQLQEAGAAMPQLYESLLSMNKVFTVQGELQPYDNGDFSRNVAIVRLNEVGGLTVVARYRDNVRLSDEELIAADVIGVAAIGTPTFTPTMTPTETATPIPSATPSQLQLTVLPEIVNVRSGPGEFYEELGELQQGTTATIIGANEDLSWLVIQYRGGIGWIAAQFVETFDPAGLLNQLPIIQAPPTPIGGVTATPRLNTSDVSIESVLLIPLQPIPGQNFIANVTVRNLSNVPSGAFTVAASFEPGPVYTSNVVTNLEGGQSVVVPLSATLTGTGFYAVDIVADINNQVNEGTTGGEANNIFRVNYTVDYPILIQTSSLPVFAGTNIDLAGGTPDLNWTGTELVPLSGVSLGIITSATFENVHFNLLDPSILSNTSGLNESQIFPGVLIGVITAEGQRGIIRVEAKAGTALTLTYKIYSTP